MKNYMVGLGVLVFISISGLSSFAGNKNGKIGYVDLQKIFSEYKKAKESENMFKKEVEEEQKKINEMQAEIKKMQSEYEKKKDLMKPEERRKKEEELKKKIQEFSKKWAEVNKKLDKRRKDLEDARLEEIKKTIKEYGKKKGYTVILDSRVILFGEKYTDLTSEIIKVLNSKK